MLCPGSGLITEKNLGVWGPLPSQRRTLLDLLGLARQPLENIQTAAQPLHASAWQKRIVNATLIEKGNNELCLPWTRDEEAVASSQPGWEDRAALYGLAWNSP